MLPVTPRAASDGTGTRARARTDRAVRCGAVKSETGHPCRRAAGAGTDHPGVGPCANHDDGSWRRPAFADNPEARQAFLAAVTAQPLAGIRELVEPLGYRRRDVTALLDASPEFEEDYIEARGYDLDSIRTELRRRAFDGGSDRLLELEAKMRLPEGQALASRMRVEGRLEVQAIVASPEWIGLRDRLLAALRPYPEALDAVLAALAGAPAETGQQALQALPPGEADDVAA